VQQDYKTTDKIGAYPLTWPLGWKRTDIRSRAKFECTVASAIADVHAELGRMGVPSYNVLISSNIELRRDGLPRSDRKIPDDPGVAVYFKLEGKRLVLACDKWRTPEDNMRAIAKHVEALRGQERWGVGSIERAFSGYAALPEKGGTSRPSWRAVLMLDGVDVSLERLKFAYRELAKIHHPDVGGDPVLFQRLNDALADARVELSGGSQ
jgi:hypothetical protein